MSVWETVLQGDAVSRGVALLLLAMSVSSWVVILWKGCNSDEMLKANLQKLDGFKLIRSFPVETTKNNEKTEYSYLLNRDTKYRIVVVDNGKKGERMAVTVRGREKKVLASNKDKQKRDFSEVFEFVCPETGIFYFEAEFENGRRDCGLNILGYQK